MGCFLFTFNNPIDNNKLLSHHKENEDIKLPLSFVELSNSGFDTSKVSLIEIKID